MSIFTKFYLDRAEYRLGTAEGSVIVMKIDYANGQYTLEGPEGEIKERAKLVAEDLIARKHGVNFSDKLKV